MESYHPLTDEQAEFVKKVIHTYSLDRKSEVLIRDFTDTPNTIEEQAFPLKLIYILTK